MIIHFSLDTFMCNVIILKQPVHQLQAISHESDKMSLSDDYRQPMRAIRLVIHITRDISLKFWDIVYVLHSIPQSTNVSREK